MSTTAAPNPAQATISDVYDPDEVVPRNSPLLQPLRPTLQPSPSPPPRVSRSPSSEFCNPGRRGPARRRQIKSSQGDALLISYLDGHRRETAAYLDPLVSDVEDTEDLGFEQDPGSPRAASPDGQSAARGEARGGPCRPRAPEPAAHKMISSSAAKEDIGAPDLKSLAAGALAAAAERAPPGQPDAGPTPPVMENDVGAKPGPAMAIHTRRTEPAADERKVTPAMLSPYSPNSYHSPRESGTTPSSFRTDMRSPTASIHSSTHSEGLRPINLSPPRYEQNGQTLPSIRSQLGDIPPLGGTHAAGNAVRSSHPGFPGSPPATMPRLPSLHSHLASPPMPPSDPYRDPLSPGYPLAAPTLSPSYYYAPSNGLRRPHDYASTSPETTGTQPPGSPPAAALDRMSIDGLTVPTAGNYVCKVPGCKAPPFQTQYLLNSHANVHSSARPHYCPVAGCPRGEGGKGFKRKNEMIRHGLVHESPGYVCPFCPDRDHRYPRPDNLQRHVRVHHTEKDKDDPLLRDVLSRRPDGPNRGRRRRGGQN